MPGRSEPEILVRVCVAGFLAWLVPGLGHLYLGQRARGWICLLTIGLTFWGGVAIGGVQDTVYPDKRTAWFMGQVCAGSHTLVACGWGRYLRSAADAADHANLTFESVDAAVVYTGIAGLLNLLAILDALARADAGPLPLPVSTARPEARGKT